MSSFWIPIILVLHILVAAALVGIVLLQKSEGGALGMGGGGFMSGRGQANFLTRTTAYLAVAFFATSILLTLLANQTTRPRSIFDAPSKAAPVAPGAPAAPGGSAPAAPAPGSTAAPAAPAPADTPAAPRGGILDKLKTQGN